MKFLSIIIPLLIASAGVIIPINALNLKSNLGRTFFTDEQKIKVRFYNTVMFSLVIAFLVAYFNLSFKFNGIDDLQIMSTALTSAIFWGSTIFIILLLITSPIFKWIDNFCIKTQIKYKVRLPEMSEPVYILRMYDKDTCVCSKDYNAEFSQQAEYILVSMEQLKGQNLIEERVPKPKRSFWSKFFDL